MVYIFIFCSFFLAIIAYELYILIELKRNTLRQISSQDLQQSIHTYKPIYPDPLYEKAVELVRKYDKVSTSLIQRNLAIGYARTSYLLDLMEKNGIVGKAMGSNPRKVIR